MVSPAKQAVRELSKRLADDCTWDDAMSALYVRQKIQQGPTDLEAGRIVSHEDVFREYADAGEDAVGKE